MLLRSVLSCATVSPRYSVSRAAFEFRNWSVSSATDASFVAMGLLYVSKRTARSTNEKSSGAEARSFVQNGRTSNTCAGPRMSRALGGGSEIQDLRARRQPAVFGSDKCTGRATQG